MAQPATLSDIYHKEINLADGGLGSTLEDILNFKIAHTPLWSTRVVADEAKSQLLVQAHLSFLRAGARTLLTSTYQAAFNTFEQEGYSREQSLRIMSDAVSIAAHARALFCAENPSIHPNEIRILLSLGTYGSTVTPMQDFTGIFPPPYGPKAYSPTGDNTTSFGDDLDGLENSIRALTAFHAERLLAYARIEEAWAVVDGIAFETVPVAREVTAIIRAVTTVADVLRTEGEGKGMKPWWLTAVFPDGRCSETYVSGGERILAKEVADLMVREGTDGDGRALVVPSGIGFNCVAVEHLSGLLDQFRDACAYVQGKEWPWLVVKPNGGGEGWAESVARCVDMARGQGWRGLIVGGCCKAEPDDIAQLAGRMRDRGYLLY